MRAMLSGLLAAVLLLSLAACGQQETEPDTLGQSLLQAFQTAYEADPQADLDTLAQGLLTQETVGFQGTTAPVEPGTLMGFGNTPIEGFSQGVMFAPVIGTIPFLGYLFRLEEGMCMILLYIIKCTKNLNHRRGRLCGHPAVRRGPAVEHLHPGRRDGGPPGGRRGLLPHVPLHLGGGPPGRGRLTQSPSPAGSWAGDFCALLPPGRGETQQVPRICAGFPAELFAGNP